MSSEGPSEVISVEFAVRKIWTRARAVAGKRRADEIRILISKRKNLWEAEVCSTEDGHVWLDTFGHEKPTMALWELYEQYFPEQNQIIGVSSSFIRACEECEATLRDRKAHLRTYHFGIALECDDHQDIYKATIDFNNIWEDLDGEKKSKHLVEDCGSYSSSSIGGAIELLVSNWMATVHE